MRKYLLSTPYGERYYIHDNGDIERTDIKDFKVSGDWKFKALQSTHPFVNYRSSVSLDDLATGNVPTTYKNGNPRFTVVDVDHGSERVWGNNQYHGIKSVQYA